MGAKEKRERERQEAINDRKRDVIEAAKEIFVEKSIEKTTMQDIANKAEVGIASVYRYFSTKTEVVMGVALDYLNSGFFVDYIPIQGTGIEQTAQLMSLFMERMGQSPHMMIFLEQLDAYVMGIQEDHTHLKVYEDLKKSSLPLWVQVIQRGQKDGSIRKDLSPETLSVTLFEMMLTLAQKAILKNQLINQDQNILLNAFKEMALHYIKSA